MSTSRCSGRTDRHQARVHRRRVVPFLHFQAGGVEMLIKQDQNHRQANDAHQAAECEEY